MKQPEPIEDAAFASKYFRELIRQGIERSDALEITKTYVMAHVLGRLPDSGEDWRP